MTITEILDNIEFNGSRYFKDRCEPKISLVISLQSMRPNVNKVCEIPLVSKRSYCLTKIAQTHMSSHFLFL